MVFEQCSLEQKLIPARSASIFCAKPDVKDRLRFGGFPNNLAAKSTPMKATALLSFMVLLTPLAAQTPIPVPATPPAAATELLPNQRAFLNLPEEKRKEFVKHLVEANRIFQQKRIFETLEEIDKASAIFNQSPELHNLRGSCYVEMRDFDKALVEYNKALALAKDNANIEFNIGEIYFVTQKWQKSLDVFEKILAPITKGNIALGRLVEFKIMLCKIKLGQDVAALADKYDYLDDSPYYYYAKAAMAYEAGNASKAEEWLATAGRVFRNPASTAPWKDTMVEYGYIKGFHANPAADGTAKPAGDQTD